MKRKVSPAILELRKNKKAEKVLNKLNDFINATEPEATFFLTRMWKDQQQAVTYKELREAILRGEIDNKTFQAWQDDYANFVNEKLKPIWRDAMETANEELAALHPDFFFDPMHKGVLKWTNEYGAKWVSSVAQEQKDAMKGMIAHSYSGAWTVDELSRAIRPLVGLNKIQANANLNYYQHVKESLLENNPTMRVKTAEGRAKEAAQKYAARQHRQRAYTIATTEMAFAYNKGAHEGVRQAQEQNLMGKTMKIWSTAEDERVCEICGGLEGTEIGMDDDFDFKGYTLYNGQKETPPAHPRCRCAIIYEEVESPKYKEPEPDLLEEWDPEDKEEAVAQEEVEDPAIPKAEQMPEGMTYKGPAHLGGTGEMHQYTDADGQEWLFKPAQSKAGNPEAFRAYAQEAGYKVQGIVDPGSAVPIGTGELGGEFGAFQKRIMDPDAKLDLKAWQDSLDKLPKEIREQLQREHVTDWLLGNYDAHGDNFLLGTNGNLIGIDKEQAFRYISKPGAQQMTYSYHPNASYGEKEPVYNTLYRRYAKGEIDLDLQDTLTYIKRVESIPDKEYREIFRDYAETRHGKGKAAESLLDQIVERKGSLREDYRGFYADLLTERTGKKQGFIWADEASQHLKQPLTAVTHTPATLDKMKVAELKQLAKNKQIPYYNSMNKAQLVTSISDPVKAPEMSQQVKDRLAANAAKRKAGATTATKVPVKPKDVVGAETVFKDLTVLPDTKLGAAIPSDKGSVEGLNLSGRKMTILNDQGRAQDIYEISGKLTREKWSEVWETAKPIGNTLDDLFFEEADTAKKLFSGKANMNASIRTITVQDGNTTYQMYIDGQTRRYEGWRGYFRVRTPVTGNGAADAKSIESMLQKLGLNDLTLNPDKLSEDTLKKARLVWQNAPHRANELDGLTGKKMTNKIDSILKEEKINAKRISKMKPKKVFDGYQTYVEEGILKEYEKAGLKHVWAGVSEAESVSKILQGPGLMANNNRFKSGMKMTGASPVEDFLKGGSDSVFTRIGVKSKERKIRYQESYLGGNYRIIIDPKVMERTDWYAYDSDNYGSTAAADMASRKSPKEFIKSMTENWRASNEIMFRHGIYKEDFIGISANTETQKTQLLNQLKKDKISEINGVPIEDFIRVEREI